MNNKPIRIQRKRTKGFELSKVANNGLPTFCVTRGTRWGNPFRINATLTREQSIERFREVISKPETIALIKEQLKDKNLACYCPLDVACQRIC